MWARTVEIMLACFLAISSFVFPDSKPLWIFNLIVALWIAVFSVLSFYDHLRKIHLMNGFAVMALIIFAWIQPDPPPPPPFQNYMTLALLLFLFIIIPSDAVHPPEQWKKFYSNHQGSNDT